MEKTPILRQNNSIELLINIGGDFIARLYGGSLPAFVYIQKLYEFLSIFGDRKTLDNYLIGYKLGQIKSKISSVLRSNENFIKLQSLLSNGEYRELPLVNILIRVSTYDPRVALLLLYALGLIPGVNNVNEFTERFQVSKNFFYNNISSSLVKLVDDLPELIVSKPPIERVEYLREYLLNLEYFDNNQLLRHTDGELILSDSSYYSVARLIQQRGENVNVNTLGTSQQRVFQICYDSYRATGRFPSLDSMIPILGISKSAIIANFRTIEEQIASNKVYVRGINGSLYTADRTLISLIYLTEKRPQVLELAKLALSESDWDLLTLTLAKDVNGIYSSSGVILKDYKVMHPGVFNNEIELSRRIVRIRSTLSMIDQTYDFFHSQMNLEKVRELLSDIHKNKSFLSSLTEGESKLVLLLMDKKDNQYLLSFMQVVAESGISERGVDKLKYIIGKKAQSYILISRIYSNVNILPQEFYINYPKIFAGITDREIRIIDYLLDSTKTYDVYTKQPIINYKQMSIDLGLTVLYLIDVMDILLLKLVLKLTPFTEG